MSTSNSTSPAGLARALGALAGQLGYWPQRVLTVAVILLLAAVNVRGVKWGGGLQLVITLVKVGSLLFFIALPFLALLWVGGSGPYRAADAARLSPVWPGPGEFTPALLSGFGSALLAVLWAYHGWQNIGPVAEAVQRPQRNIPLALLGGTAVIVALYLGASTAYSLVLTQDEMKAMKDQAVAVVFC